MKLEGQRADGVLLVNIGAGQRVLFHPARREHSRPIDGADADKYGPWKDADHSHATRMEMQRLLERSHVVDLKHLATAPAPDVRYRELTATVPAIKLAYEGEHPFTHCMEVIVPAMENPPDDPEAFCAWWKEQNASVQHMATTYTEALTKVGEALRSKLGLGTTSAPMYAGGSDFWVRDMNDTDVFYQIGGKSFRQPYTYSAETEQYAFDGDPVEIEQTWVDKPRG